nr:MAG TPA: hypothetical protein [Bacteriophage sp.]
MTGGIDLNTIPAVLFFSSPGNTRQYTTGEAAR